MVRQAHLAGPRRTAAANERCHLKRMLWRAKRPLHARPFSWCEQTGDGLNGDDVQRFVFGERGEDRRHATRQHRLAAPRWSHQEQSMAAGSRNFGGALGVFLARDVAKINGVRR